MKLWVRSQNKEISMNVDNIFIKPNNEKTYDILTGKNGVYYYLGTYETKKRALEVLNLLEQRFEGCLGYRSPVFKMPEN